MKKSLVLGLTLCSATLLFTGCKSQESAYRQAFEKAKAQEQNNAGNETAVVNVAPTGQNNNQSNVAVTPVTTAPTAQVDHSDVRTIAGGITVVRGEALRAYSVVVGSFVTLSNAESLMTTLKNKGCASRVVKTNETINGHTGWYRVIATSYDDKASAARSRDELQSTYAGAWLLYNK